MKHPGENTRDEKAPAQKADAQGRQAEADSRQAGPEKVVAETEREPAETEKQPTGTEKQPTETEKQPAAKAGKAGEESRMGTAPIPGLMFRLAIPAVIAQLINVLYNIVDRMYIGHIPEIGATALTGVGVTFPILMLISAFSSFVGAGGAPLASIHMGKGNMERAERILGNSVTLLLFFSAVLTVGFLIFRRPLLYLFGASDATIVYADSYTKIYLLGTVFVQLALGLNMFISAQGMAQTAMLSVLVGAVANIILDPIFIFLFDMGVAGAAWATILSQALSAAWVLYFLLSPRSALRIRRRYLRPSLPLIRSIMALGVSRFIMQATESAINVVLNRGLLAYGGDLYVGSMTVLQSVMQLIVVPVNGFAQGVQPIISYNFGAGLFQRVRKTYRITISLTFGITCVCCLLTVLFPGVFAAIFTDQEELIQLVVRVMPVFMGGIWLFGIQMGCQTVFLGLGQAKASLFLALLRKVILLIPLAILLPILNGGDVMGIYWAEPISDMTSAAIAGILFLLCRNKILSQEALDRVR